MKTKFLRALFATTALVALAGGVYAATNAPPPATPVYSVWSNLNSNAITAATTPGANATSLVLKAAPGNLYSVYATNATATAGKLLVMNATSAPTANSGNAVTTILDCVTLPASGSASIDYTPGPAHVYSIGVTALISSNASCYVFDQSTAAITAFISGVAP